MKILSLPFLALGVGAIAVVGGGTYMLSGSHSTAPAAQPSAASTPSPNGAVVSSDTSGGEASEGGKHGHGGKHMPKAFMQLGLTDAQTQQIQQLMQTVTDKKERMKQVMAVLTPEQRAKFKELRASMGKKKKMEAGSEATTGSTTTPNTTATPSGAQ